ncbi:MAG TPA: hypothetical protein VHT52_12935 [Stellaceae bacterium]|jgi:hypothetical protein|nr:hypothetical protein [Stellaceae bacterium]
MALVSIARDTGNIATALAHAWELSPFTPRTRSFAQCCRISKKRQAR